MVAQVAADEPETEPKIPQPKMVVCISRPGTRLSQGRRPSNISSLSLVRNKISPIQMNRGRAASSQLALLSQNAENKFLPGWVLVKKACPTQPQMAKVMAIHTPPLSSSNMMNSSKPPMSKMSTLRPRRRSHRARGALSPRAHRWARHRATPAAIRRARPPITAPSQKQSSVAVSTAAWAACLGRCR